MSTRKNFAKNMKILSEGQQKIQSFSRYSWGEIDFVTKPLNEMRLMECTECEMSAPGAYDIDIEADDINVTDTATVIWEIA